MFYPRNQGIQRAAVPFLLLALGALPLCRAKESARHESGGHTGTHGIRELVAFKINKRKEGKDKLLAILDLGDHAFESKAPEELAHKRIRITLGRASWEGNTDERGQVKDEHLRIKLIRNGNGMKILVRKGDFDQLASQIEEDEHHFDALFSVYVLEQATGTEDDGDHDHAHSRHEEGEEPGADDAPSGFGTKEADTPPTVAFTYPEEGQTFDEEDVTVKYLITGAYDEVDHAHLKLDEEPEIGKHEPVGEYTFTGLDAGVHVVRVNLRHADHSPLTNTEATAEVTFVVEPYGEDHTHGNEMLYQREVGMRLLQTKNRILGRE